MPSVQPKELQDLDQNLNMRINDKEVRMQLGTVYSRNNLARPVSAQLTGNYTATYKDAFLYFNTTAAGYTLTLPPANSWGAGKSTFLLVYNLANGSANNITIAVNAADTFNGNALTIAPGEMMILFCNGVSVWFGSKAV